MQIQPNIPEFRRRDPRRRAELEVHYQLAASDLPGRAIYEARASAAGPEVDFAIWLQDQGRFDLQVKGGRYSLQDGDWYLHTDDGPERKDCLLKEASDGAFSIWDAVKRRLDRKVFLVPVLLFPDMDPDLAIQARAAGDKTHILWGSEDLVERRRRLARDVEVRYPPTGEQMRREADAVGPGLGLGEDPALPREGAAGPSPATMDLSARQVIIHHADTVNVHTTGANDGLPGGVA